MTKNPALHTAQHSKWAVMILASTVHDGWKQCQI